MRLFSALGPGDIVTAYRKQIGGDASGAGTSYTFSGQIAEYCRERDFVFLGVSHCDRADREDDGQIAMINLPLSHRRFGRSISSYWRAMVLARLARRFGADLAIIDSGSAHFFALLAFRVVGVPVAINFHNVLWPTGFPPQRMRRKVVLALDSLFFRFGAVATLGCANEIQRQVARTGGATLPFFRWQSQFPVDALQPLPRPDMPPVRILFVGSVERSKGVFDLTEIAQTLIEKHGIDVMVDICGVGPALEELKQAARVCGERFVFHGWLARTALVARYHAANIVIVPTRRDIGEGMPQVCAEAALLGIPLVTSPLSNASDDLADAMIEVPSEDVDAYVRAIAAIATDRALAARLASAGPICARGFVDRRKSYPAAIDAMLCAVFPERVTKLESFDGIFERVF